MSAAVIVTTLFPNPGPRPARRATSGTRLSHLMALGFALLPLAVMGQVLDWA